MAEGLSRNDLLSLSGHTPPGRKLDVARSSWEASARDRGLEHLVETNDVDPGHDPHPDDEHGLVPRRDVGEIGKLAPLQRSENARRTTGGFLKYALEQAHHYNRESRREYRVWQRFYGKSRRRRFPRLRALIGDVWVLAYVVTRWIFERPYVVLALGLFAMYLAIAFWPES